jgi:hypothetical protein
MRMNVILPVSAAIASLVAAVYWLLASLVPVPDNIDTLVSELQRAARLNSYGALAASIAATLGAILAIRQIKREGVNRRE